LKTLRVVFKKDAEILLSHASGSLETEHIVLKERNHSLWQEKGVGNSLQELLGSSMEVYLDITQEIQKRLWATEDLTERLKVIKDNEVLERLLTKSTRFLVS
jgi:hypothetical protein